MDYLEKNGSTGLTTNSIKSGDILVKSFSVDIIISRPVNILQLKFDKMALRRFKKANWRWEFRVFRRQIDISMSHLFEFFTNTQGWQCWHYCQLCAPIYLQFSSVLTSTNVCKREIRNQRAYEDYILRINVTLNWLVFNSRAKTKLAMLAFLHCGEIVKNSIENV